MIEHPIVISSRRIIYDNSSYSIPFFNAPLRTTKYWMTEEDYKDIIKWANDSSNCD